MKKLLYIFFISALACRAQSGEKPVVTPSAGATSTVTPSAAAEITFDQTQYWFGILQKGSPVVHKFYYRNTGNVPLIISECKAGCVCTTAKCAKDPVAPGETGFIEVHYDSTHIGTFAKDFFIKSNAKNGTIDLIIRGIIQDTPAATEEKEPAKK